MSCEYIIVLMAVPWIFQCPDFHWEDYDEDEEYAEDREFRRRLCELGTSPSQLPVGSQGMTWALPRLCLKFSAAICVFCPAWRLFKTGSCDQFLRNVYSLCNEWCICNANLSMLFTTDWSWDRECMHTGGLRLPVWGPHRVGIRAILTLGDLS